MKASVIIPVFNAEKTIIETLKGLELQASRDFEVIVVDDGSTDSSPSLVTQFSSSSDIPIRVIRQENSGPARARNRGVEHASGEIVVFLDSDGRSIIKAREARIYEGVCW